MLATRQVTFSELIKAQGRVIGALILRDIKTRFFGNALGFVVTILWPLTHCFSILLVNTVAGRAAPYGDSAVLWFASGTIPFVAFSYMSRFIMIGIIMNKTLLAFPVVKVTDILFARAIVEVISAACVIILTVIIISFMGVDWFPSNLTQACFAIGTALLLGFGWGTVNAIVAAAVPGWMFGFILFQVLMWVVSGVVFNVDGLPAVARYWLSFNPVLQCVEWLRSAYYEGVGVEVLDKPYVIGFALTCTALGLGLERLVRGKIMS